MRKNGAAGTESFSERTARRRRSKSEPRFAVKRGLPPAAFAAPFPRRPLPEGQGGDEEGEKQIRIERIHIEEDAGKLNHDEYGRGTFVDLNRAGVPLIEVVSKPDLRSASEVDSYLRKLK